MGKYTIEEVMFKMVIRVANKDMHDAYRISKLTCIFDKEFESNNIDVDKRTAVKTNYGVTITYIVTGSNKHKVTALFNHVDMVFQFNQRMGECNE